jgi:hypothetical protein
MAQESMVGVTPDDDNVEIKVEVVGDEIAQDDKRTPAATDYKSDEMSDEEMGELGGRAQKRINKLTWEKNEERRNKEAAERMSTEAIDHGKRLNTENERLRGALKKTQEELTSQATKRADGALRAAEEAFKIAYAEGDGEKVAEAQKAMTASMMAKSYAPSVAGRIVRDYVNEYDAAAKQGQAGDPAAPAPIPTEPPPPDAQTQAWFDKNPWFGVGPQGDTIMTSTAYGIHEHLIVKEKIVPETPEYYNRLDAEIRKIFPDRFEAPTGDGGTVVDVAPTASQTPLSTMRVDTVVAPATRNNGASASQTIRLTETQVATAKRMGVPIENYAREVLKEARKANV